MKSADGLMGPGPPLASKRVLDWLLEDDQPAVQYLTLKELVGKAEDDPESKARRNSFRRKGGPQTFWPGRIPRVGGWAPKACTSRSTSRRIGCSSSCPTSR